jgi:hypothetical protein
MYMEIEDTGGPVSPAPGKITKKILFSPTVVRRRVGEEEEERSTRLVARRV